MAAPSNTVRVPSPTNNEASFFTYLREVLLGAATFSEEVPAANASEAAHLLEEFPVVGTVCKTFLAFEQLVETARSNKDDLATLRELCCVVVAGVLDKRSDRSGLSKRFEALEKHVNKAEEVAQLCNSSGRVKRKVLARRICEDIVSVMNNVVEFCAANNVAISNDTNAKVVKLGMALDDKIEAMQRLTITQADHEAEEKAMENLRRAVETKDEVSLNLQAGRCSGQEASATMQTELETRPPCGQRSRATPCSNSGWAPTRQGGRWRPRNCIDERSRFRNIS
ncbi:unnamed protein product [Ectocarpus sp. CCAP 1310/34]|nr:unnamed protein product [Ectocarpus sp. CCAP 1310/34]